MGNVRASHARFIDAQPANPSFDCSRAQTPDEHVICEDSRLAELDQAVSIAYRQAELKNRSEALATARDTLAARHACSNDRLCILDQQVNAISIYADLGSQVPTPPWAGSYRVDLTQVKYDLVADRVNQLSDRWTTVPTEQRTALRIEA